MDQALGTYVQIPTGCSHLGLIGFEASGPSGVYAAAQGRRAHRERLRPRSLSGKIRDHERATDDELFDLSLWPRPQTREECPTERPCPYVSCRHHLFIEVNPLTGSVQFPFGDLEIDEIPNTCSLDAALDGPMTLDELGVLMGKTKQRTFQLEASLLRKLKSSDEGATLVTALLANWQDQ